jgi:hypothetical protein
MHNPYDGDAPYSPAQPPQRKRHRTRTVILSILGGISALIVVVVLAAILTSPSGQSSPGGHRANVAPASSSATQASVPSAQPTTPGPQPPTQVQFVITGHVPAQDYGDVDVDYGSSSDSHQITLPDLDGTKTYTLPFDASTDYYTLNVTFEGGDVSCKIIATAPQDNPLTVSSGHATGDNICSAQAAPEDNGLTWSNEQ